MVSILARPEGRALPPAPSSDASCSEFQSSPAPKDGRYSARPAPPPRTDRFQSSPAPKDGRYHGVSGVADHGTRFNPRPPRRTGATARLRVY